MVVINSLSLNEFIHSKSSTHYPNNKIRFDVLTKALRREFVTLIPDEGPLLEIESYCIV